MRAYLDWRKEIKYLYVNLHPGCCASQFVISLNDEACANQVRVNLPR